jgi:nicotinamidase-related amidase
MKNKFALKIQIVLLCISLNLFQDLAFGQERCILVLDIQQFSKKSKQLDASVQEMIQNVNSLIGHAKPENVIYIKATGKALSITSKGFSVDTLPAPDFDSSLKIVSDNIFVKIEGDAFTSPELIRFLDDKKVGEIVLVGLMAEKCLYNTAIGGKDRGYSMVVVPEGIVGATQKKKEKAIEKLKGKGIKFMPMAEMINAQE